MATQLAQAPTNLVLIPYHEGYDFTFDWAGDGTQQPVTSYQFELMLNGSPTGQFYTQNPDWGHPFGLFAGAIGGTGSSISARMAIVNSMGVGAFSAQSNVVIHGENWTVPNAPTNLQLVNLNGNYKVTFDFVAGGTDQPDVWNFQFEATKVAGGGTISSTLNNSGSVVNMYWAMEAGQEYDIKIKAVNVIGASLPSNTVRITHDRTINFTVPGPVQSLIVTAGEGAIDAQCFPPLTDGGTPVTEYMIEVVPGRSFSQPGSSFHVDALTNGVECSVTVRAYNGIGYGPGVTLYATPFAPVAADAPTITNIELGNGSALIHFDKPASNGGPAPKFYRATSTPGGIVSYSARSPIVVADLTNDTSYGFTVAAINEFGDSPESVPMTGVMPSANLSFTVPSGALPSPKRTGFRATVGATETLDTEALFRKMVTYIEEAGFQTITHINAGFEAGYLESVSFRPVWEHRYPTMTPKWAINLITPNAGAQMMHLVAYAGEDFTKIEVDPDNGQKKTEQQVWWPDAGKLQEIYFYADGKTGEWGFFHFFQNEAPYLSGQTAYIGATMEMPFQMHQTPWVFPYFGIAMPGDGFMAPWVKTFPQYYNNADDTSVEGYYTDQYMDIVSPLGGWAPEGNPLAQKPAAPFAKSLGDILVLPGGPREQLWVGARLNRVMVATNDGWNDWDLVGDMIVTPYSRWSSTSTPSGPRWAVPCPLGGPAVENVAEAQGEP